MIGGERTSLPFKITAFVVAAAFSFVSSMVTTYSL